MMKTKKGKTRIKLKKLLLFLLMVVLAIALLVLGTEKIVHFAAGRMHADEAKPTYYLFIGEDETAGSEADAMLLLADNDKKKEMTFISIPPNTKVVRQEKTNLLLRIRSKKAAQRKQSQRWRICSTSASTSMRS